MANGKSSIHPDTYARLRKAGVKSSGITQGVGYATASAGTHAPVGKHDGNEFGHCIDVTPDVDRGGLAFTRENFDALVALGFVSFPRTDWSAPHWHLVDASRPMADGNRQPDHLEKVNHQLAEWVRFGDGLVGDRPMPAPWRPTAQQTERVRNVWITGEVEDPDAPSDWAEESWKWAKANGVVTSTPPKASVTAEWVIVVVHRLWKMALKTFARKEE